MNTKLKTDKLILDYGFDTDYELMMEYIDIFINRYDFLVVNYIGTSIMGRKIPMLMLGDESAEKKVMYIGAHHGMEWITTVFLLRFVNEYCEYYKTARQVFGVNLKYLFNSRLICIVPMLNPDGVDLQINGLRDDNPIRERLLSMNGSDDFSHWQANGRGVDLNHNYNAGFFEYKPLEAAAGILGGAPTRYSGEHPESEPETGALCSYLRFNDDVKLAITLHTQGEEIYYTSGGYSSPRSRTIGRLLEKMTGYKLCEPEGMAAYGGFTDWFLREFERPSFTVECGRGENPLDASEYFPIYASIREMLFSAPVLI